MAVSNPRDSARLHIAGVMFGLSLITEITESILVRSILLISAKTHRSAPYNLPGAAKCNTLMGLPYFMLLNAFLELLVFRKSIKLVRYSKSNYELGLELKLELSMGI